MCGTLGARQRRRANERRIPTKIDPRVNPSAFALVVELKGPLWSSSKGLTEPDYCFEARIILNRTPPPVHVLAESSPVLRVGREVLVQ